MYKRQAGTGLTSGTRGQQVITVPVNSTTGAFSFTITYTTANGSSLTLDRQPFESDFIVSETRNILNPIKIQGKIYLGLVKPQEALMKPCLVAVVLRMVIQ